MSRYASPMLAADDEHAVEKLSIGPRKPCAIETCAAAALFMPSTTAVGRTRRPADSKYLLYESSIVAAPPSPVPQ